MKLAQSIFNNIDLHKQGVLNENNLTVYFKEYTETCVRVILEGIDLNQDGIITRKEWMAYWEYVREAGYSDRAILKSVSIPQGSSNRSITESRIWPSRRRPTTRPPNPEPPSSGR
jgi:hypothetical protein